MEMRQNEFIDGEEDEAVQRKVASDGYLHCFSFSLPSFIYLFILQYRQFKGNKEEKRRR